MESDTEDLTRNLGAPSKATGFDAAHALIQRALAAPSDARRIAACVAVSGLDAVRDRSDRHTADTLLLGAQFEALIGAQVDGVRLAVRAVRIAELLDDAALKQRSLSLAGELLAECGAVADGMVHAVAGLDASVAIAQPQAGSSAWCALAKALLATGQTQSALVAARHALTLARLCPDPLHATRAMCSIALASLYQDDVETALRTAWECSGRLDDARSLEEHVLCAQAEHHYARALARSGRLGLARQRAELALRHANASGSSVAHAYALVASAMCDSGEGSHVRAAERLQAALAQSVPQVVLPAMHALVEAGRRSNDRGLLVETRRKLYAETRARQVRAAQLQAALARRAGPTGDAALNGANARDDRLARATPADPLDRLEEAATALEAGEHPSDVLRLYRCGRLAAMLATDLGWPESVVLSLERAARLHAIGKLYVPPEVTTKRGPLTAGERSLVENAYALGSELLEAAGLRQQPILWDVVQNVAEHWDGTGPRRLAGEKIPMAARIVAVAAAYISLTSRRPFRPAFAHHEAVARLESQAGTKLDPTVTARAILLLSSAQPRVAGLEVSRESVVRSNRFVRVQDQLEDLLEAGDER